MKIEIEVPDNWDKEKKGWHIDSFKLMSCSQCPYKTPDPGLYVTHVFIEHGYKEPETLTLDP